MSQFRFTQRELEVRWKMGNWLRHYAPGVTSFVPFERPAGSDRWFADCAEQGCTLSCGIALEMSTDAIRALARTA